MRPNQQFINSLNTRNQFLSLQTIETGNNGGVLFIPYNWTGSTASGGTVSLAIDEVLPTKASGPFAWGDPGSTASIIAWHGIYQDGTNFGDFGTYSFPLVKPSFYKQGDTGSPNFYLTGDMMNMPFILGEDPDGIGYIEPFGYTYSGTSSVVYYGLNTNAAETSYPIQPGTKIRTMTTGWCMIVICIKPNIKVTLSSSAITGFSSQVGYFYSGLGGGNILNWYTDYKYTIPVCVFKKQ